MSNVGLKLRELRHRSRLTQQQVAQAAGLGAKTISSFETGTRVGAMKLSQLESLVAVYGLTLEQFFSTQLESLLFPWDGDHQTEKFFEEVRKLPAPVKDEIVPWMRSVVRGATLKRSEDFFSAIQVRDDADWAILVSPN